MVALFIYAHCSEHQQTVDFPPEVCYDDSVSSTDCALLLVVCFEVSLLSGERLIHLSHSLFHKASEVPH